MLEWVKDKERERVRLRFSLDWKWRVYIYFRVSNCGVLGTAEWNYIGGTLLLHTKRSGEKAFSLLFFC